MKQIQTSDRVLGTIQQNVTDAITAIQGLPMLNSQLVQVSASPNTDLLIRHNLSRAPVAYSIQGSDANCVVWTSGTPNTLPASQLILRASASANITLLLF